MMQGIPHTALGREENKLVVIRTKPTCMGRTSATAHICITNKEIGHICMVADADANYFRIDSFGVEEKHRQKGVGRKLVEAMIVEAKRLGGSKIIVYPNPESYSDEEPLDIETLYKIYENLGFTLDNPAANLRLRNNKMIMCI